ncbi:spike protein [Luteibacter phage vB_LflM-Pluto]|uniref:Spike protein n=1 Tax=Luteibacter phage vB_LflM-Pluto TaxID=2948611 RepID=A0A9E7SN53_9CAUD|nr:spike protein [Luteibacter phage vB_LflM-Pluto]
MPSSTTPLTSLTPPDKSRLWPALAEMMRQNGLNTDGMLPAQIVEYDRVNNVATVKPLIMWVTVGDAQLPRHPMAKIAVLSLGGGGFHVSFPIKEGDIGWILSSDRDISLFKQSLAEATPNSGRMHRFEDGMFIPDVFRRYVLNEEDEGAMVIQSVDGLTRIAIDESGEVRVTAPGNALFRTPLATFSNDVLVMGHLTVDNGATVNNDVVVDGTSVNAHGHIQTAVAGQRTSDGMIP